MRKIRITNFPELRIAIIFILLSSSVFAQVSEDSLMAQYGIKNKKALHLYMDAGLYFRQGGDRIELATENYKDAVALEPNFAQAWYSLGSCYFRSRQDSSAIICYSKAVELQPKKVAHGFFMLGEIYLDKGNYKQAKTYYENYLENETRESPYKNPAEKNLATCNFALNAMEHPLPFEPKNLGPNINSEYDDYFPSLTADGEKIFFTSTRRHYSDSQLRADGRYDEDFYFSIKKDGAWQTAENLGEPVNTPDNEGASTITSDGQSVIYIMCDNPAGLGGCDLYSSSLNGISWSEPENLGLKINSPYWDSQPSISADGNTLYFTSGRPSADGFGGKDIWYCTKEKDGTWSEPKNCGNVINTNRDEVSPFIHANGHTLFFASNGHLGMGGYDLFYSELNENPPDGRAGGEWSEPKNLGYPINQSKDEAGLIITSDGKTAYFNTDALSGSVGQDIYYFTLPEEVRPKAVGYVKGIVSDIKTNIFLDAEVLLVNLKNKDTLQTTHTNKATGEFLVMLPLPKGWIPTDADYAVFVSKQGYLFYSENFSLKQTTKSEPHILNIKLQPLAAGAKIILKNIFFNTGSYELLSESEPELLKVYSLMKQNPNIKVELSGHTDNVGTDADNQKLSQNRADAVKKFLVEKARLLYGQGIDASRIVTSGYGETKPIAANDTEEGRQMNRRTEFRILE